MYPRSLFLGWSHQLYEEICSVGGKKVKMGNILMASFLKFKQKIDI